MDLLKPIPKVHKKDSSIANIVECGEELIALEDIEALANSVHFRFKDMKNYKKTYVRKTIAIKLIMAIKLLPTNLKLGINEGYRSLEKQIDYFEERVKELSRKYPEMERFELIKKANIFVATPYDLELYPPPHCTGAAIDVVIMDDENEKLAFDSGCDDFSDESYTRYYEERAEQGMLTADEKVYLNNRRLLYNIMTSVGFVNYEKEFWHYGYGDILSFEVTGKDVIYTCNISF